MSMGNEAFEYADKNLQAFLKAISTASGPLPYARLGVLGGHNARKGEGSNAEIGQKHEFGDDGLPIRSWLRMPITTHLQKELEKSGAFEEEAILKIINEGDIEKWMKKVGIVGESCVSQAFDTGGFGQWKPSDMRFKKVKQTLVETQQLRNSVTSDVKK